MRAIFEICLKRGWAVPAKAALDMCKMVERRMYVLSFLPLHSFAYGMLQVEFADSFASVQGRTCRDHPKGRREAVRK